MKVGDLVKRTNYFSEWIKHNSWMTADEENEIGIIIQWDRMPDVVVLWPSTGLSREDQDEIELVVT